MISPLTGYGTNDRASSSTGYGPATAIENDGRNVPKWDHWQGCPKLHQFER